MNPDLPVVDDTAVWDAWLGVYQTPAISVALELGIFELLQEPADVSALAGKAGFSPRGLKALLGMLKCLRLVDRREGKWTLNQSSRTYMLKESPFYWGPFFAYTAASLPLHALLLKNVKGEATGEGRPVQGWEAGNIDEALAVKLTDFMHCHSIAAALGLAKTCDFSGVKRL